MNRAQNMVMASFVADSFALGLHWIYDINELAAKYSDVAELRKPGPDSYHKTKDKGEFTHYGDQTFVLLQSLSDKKSFDLADFSTRWRELFANYSGYVDHATENTLQNYTLGWEAEDAGSGSTDLAGAARIAPIVYRYHDDEKALVEAAVAQTRMTHKSSMVLDCAAFFSRMALACLQGKEVPQALESALGADYTSPVKQWVDIGLESVQEDTSQAINSIGQSCYGEHAFSGVIHLVMKYQESIADCLTANVLAGGDSAARGMICGMILGASEKGGELPAHWVSEMKKSSEIKAMIEGLQK